MYLRKRRNPGIPFQQRARAARELVGEAVELPDGLDHAAVVGVDAVGAEVRVAGEVELDYSLVGQ